MVTPEYLARMRDILAHRGPDGADSWISSDRRIGLAFRRLAIIDLSSAADQPMSNDDGRYHLVFNGEIYNHAEIRRELEATRRYVWRTDHSDTEVILRAFEEWGIECIHRFRGMFAFAIWDDRARELWLVRDRIGVKPLYFSTQSGRLTFASEIKALLQDPSQRREVDETAFFHFLSFLTVPAPATLFSGIEKLPAATWMRVRGNGEVTQSTYWTPYDGGLSNGGLTFDDAAAQVLETLTESVRLRQVADVQVGVFLSGGVDSSANAALFSATTDKAVKTFTIGYEGHHPSYPDETGFARDVARALGVEHFTRRLNSSDAVDFLQRMVWLQDEPIADPVCVPLYYVAELARAEGVTVCQVGEGADELFLGYAGWQRMLSLQKLADRAGPGLSGAAARAASLGGSRAEWPEERLRRASLGQPVFWSGAEAFTSSQKDRLLSRRMRSQFEGRTSWEVIEPIRRRFDTQSPDQSAGGWMSYADLQLRLPELLLMRVDKMTMGVSLECRVPFLDHRFVELAMSIPSELKVRNGEPKSLLKHAVRHVIPESVARRPKQGFGIPVQEWLATSLGDHMKSEVRAFTRATDLLDAGEAERVLSSGTPNQVWYLANLAMWWSRFIEGAVPSPPAGPT